MKHFNGDAFGAERPKKAKIESFIVIQSVAPRVWKQAHAVISCFDHVKEKPIEDLLFCF